jgi:filamin
VDNGDGTYTVTYLPEHPGEYSADVRIDGQSLAGFPKKVHVREGTQGEVSEFGKFAFTVVARDKRNAVKTFGGDPFEVTISGSSEAISVNATDNADGTYTASYTVGVGRYLVRVVLNGKEVVGSPFVQKVGSVKGAKAAPVHTSAAKINC